MSETKVSAFVRQWFNGPLPPKVLNAHAGVACLDVQHTPVYTLLLRRLEATVDLGGVFVIESGAADAHGQRARVVCGDSLSLSGGIDSALSAPCYTKQLQSLEVGSAQNAEEREGFCRVRLQLI